jgi:hypothetical protein
MVPGEPRTQRLEDFSDLEVTDLGDTGRVATDTSRVVTDTGRMVTDTSRVASDTSRVVTDTGRMVTDTSRVASDTSRVVTDTGRVTERGVRPPTFRGAGSEDLVKGTGRSSRRGRGGSDGGLSKVLDSSEGSVDGLARVHPEVTPETRRATTRTARYGSEVGPVVNLRHACIRVEWPGVSHRVFERPFVARQGGGEVVVREERIAEWEDGDGASLLLGSEEGSNNRERSKLRKRRTSSDGINWDE